MSLAKERGAQQRPVPCEKSKASRAAEHGAWKQLPLPQLSRCWLKEKQIEAMMEADSTRGAVGVRPSSLGNDWEWTHGPAAFFRFSVGLFRRT